MRHLILVFTLALTLALPITLQAQEAPPDGATPAPAAVEVVAPVAPVVVPVEPVDVPSGVGQVVEAYQAGGWLAAGAAAVMLLTLLLRVLGLLDRIPKRLRVVVPLALGCVSALLASVAGGLPWGQALIVAFLTGPAAVGLHQGIARSLMGVDSPQTAALKSAAGK
jgi:hypothetical protein